MASNAAEVSQAAAETVDVVADRLQQLDASTSGNECVLRMLPCGMPVVTPRFASNTELCTG